MSATRTETLEPLMIAPAAEQPTSSCERETGDDSRPQLLLPGDDRIVSEFAEQLGRELAPHRVWFVKDQRVVTIEERRLNGCSVTHAFREMDASTARTRIENYIVPCTFRPRKDSQQKAVRVRKTIGKETMQAVLDCQQFKRQLPPVERILDLPVPMFHEEAIVQVRSGYDERFRTYCPVSAPEPEQLTLSAAREVLEEIHREFCFVDESAKTMAIARMLTPYCRGLMGFSARPPVWMFEGNRPRAGKDYLAGCTTVLYEGCAHEDLPLGKNSEETQKRIMAAAQAGRRTMHFANCKGHLDDDGFEQAATAKTLGGRLLGRNDAGASLQVPNEIKFSLSANAGFIYSEDLSLRVRKISLSFGQEDANARQFAIPDLHGWIWSHRARIVGALHTLVRHWDQQGRPAGPTPFSSFPEWARVVGGIMVCCGLGDPCVSQATAGLTQDENTEHMKLLFQAAYNHYGEEDIRKADLLSLIDHPNHGDLFPWFDRSKKAHQMLISKILDGFNGRELGVLRMEIDRSNQSRSKIRFRRLLPAGNSAPDSKALQTCEPNEPQTQKSKNHPMTETAARTGEEREPATHPSLPRGPEGSQGSQVRTEDHVLTGRERLSRLNPVKEPSQAFSA